MNANLIREQVTRAIAVLPDQDLRAVLEYVDYLRWRTWKQPSTLPAEIPATDFWQGATLAELAAAQGVQPLRADQTPWGDFWPEEEAVEEFIAAVRQWRQEDLT